MKVQDVMTYGAQSCQPNTNLAKAAMQMWRGDFGFLPVISSGGKIVGVITDRDICMAAATKHRDISKVPVSDVMSGRVCTCSPHTDIHAALEIMRQQKVRRLPVVNADDGQLTGILSLNDLTLKARQHREPELSADDVEETLSEICAHRPLPLAEINKPAAPQLVPV